MGARDKAFDHWAGKAVMLRNPRPLCLYCQAGGEGGEKWTIGEARFREFPCALLTIGHELESFTIFIVFD